MLGPRLSHPAGWKTFLRKKFKNAPSWLKVPCVLAIGTELELSFAWLPGVRWNAGCLWPHPLGRTGSVAGPTGVPELLGLEQGRQRACRHTGPHVCTVTRGPVRHSGYCFHGKNHSGAAFTSEH